MHVYLEMNIYKLVSGLLSREKIIIMDYKYC